MQFSSARITVIDPSESFILAYTEGTNTVRAKVQWNNGEWKVGTVQIHDSASKSVPFEDDNQVDEIKFDIENYLLDAAEQITSFISSSTNGESKVINCDSNQEDTMLKDTLDAQLESATKEKFIGFTTKLMESCDDKELIMTVLEGFETIFEAKERKTEDEYQIHGNYGHGWEEVTSEATMKEARERLKEYRENERQASFKIVHKRVKKPVTEAFDGTMYYTKIYDILDQNGWVCYQSVKKTGGGLYYYIDKDHGKKPVPYEILRQKITEVYGNNATFNTGVSEFAPEQKKIIIAITKPKYIPSNQRAPFTFEGIETVPSTQKPTVSVKVTFDNGDSLNTSINGDLESAKAYYLGKEFTFGTDESNEYKAKCVNVEEVA